MRREIHHGVAGIVACLVAVGCAARASSTTAVDGGTDALAVDDAILPGSDVPIVGFDVPIVGGDVPVAGPDVPAVEPDVPPTRSTVYEYVITGVALDNLQMPNGTRGMSGFNLDGRYSPQRTRDLQEFDCDHGDFFSALDPDQNMVGGACTEGASAGGATCHGGVDNQFPELVTTFNGLLPSRVDLAANYRDRIRAGRWSVALRVEGVDGAPGPSLDDPDVTLRVYPVAHPLFADCARIGTAGQRYAVDASTVRAAGDLTSARLSFPARIVGGRLLVDAPTRMASAPDFALSVPWSDGEPAQFPLYNTQLRFDLVGGVGTRGNLGGFMLLRDLLRLVSTLPSLPIDATTLQGIFAGFVDVATPIGADTASCGGRGSIEGGIGIGVGFEVTRVTLASTAVTGAPAGQCGAP